MNELLGLSEIHYNKLKSLIDKRFKVVLDYFNTNDIATPENIDFIRLYFNLHDMEIITIYSHNGSKYKYDFKKEASTFVSFEDLQYYLILSNLEVDNFETWEEFIEQYGDLEFTYGDRIKYLSNFIQEEYKAEIIDIRLQQLGVED